jgi:hypothetical protein
MEKMKKLLLSLSIVFLLVSCQTDNMENETNPFVGTWEDRDEYVIEQFIFSADYKVTRTIQALSPEIENETNIGTYDYDELIIYFSYQMPVDSTITTVLVSADYSINDNELTMTFLNRHKTYTYKKIK